jgi:hypothetical protein
VKTVPFFFRENGRQKGEKSRKKLPKTAKSCQSALAHLNIFSPSAASPDARAKAVGLPKTAPKFSPKPPQKFYPHSLPRASRASSA